MTTIAIPIAIPKNINIGKYSPIMPCIPPTVFPTSTRTTKNAPTQRLAPQQTRHRHTRAKQTYYS